MPCGSCGSASWYVKRIEAKGELCSNCASISAMSIHDVYFDKPGTHHGIYDGLGIPVFVGSRSDKVKELAKRGFIEAGDRVRGAQSYDPISHRHAMKSLEKRRLK